MDRIKLSADQPARILVEHVDGDLRLRGWDQMEVAVQSSEGTLDQDADGRILAQSTGDLDLRLPLDANVEIAQVGGDAKITSLNGPLRLNHVGGDLIVRDVAACELGYVGGDLRVKRAGGSATIGHVGGDATIREVENDTTIQQIGGDLYVRDINGACAVERVGADLVLSTDFVPDCTYRFTVGGDIVCRVPAEANARFIARAGGGLQLDAVPADDLIEHADHDEIVFGDGAARVELEAGGDIQLVAQEEDYMLAINFQLEENLAERLNTLGDELTAKLSGLDELLLQQSDRIRNQAERQAERALRQAEKATRKATKRRSFKFSFGGDPLTGRPQRSRTAQPAEPADPVSDEERLLILRMVENKQISVEEAEKLLAALEGKNR